MLQYTGMLFVTEKVIVLSLGRKIKKITVHMDLDIKLLFSHFINIKFYKNQ